MDIVRASMKGFFFGLVYGISSDYLGVLGFPYLLLSVLFFLLLLQNTTIGCRAVNFSFYVVFVFVRLC